MPLLYLPRQFHVNSAGSPYAGAKLLTYRAGTTTNLDVYTTSALSVAHTNPVVADANGIFPAIYINPASGYDLKVILRTSADVDIYTEDNIPRQESAFANGTFSGNVSVTGTLGVTGATTLSGVQVTSTEPRVKLYESDQGTDLKFWDIDASAGALSIRTRTDADAAGKNILVATRGTTTALASIAIGNATDAPTISFNGTTVITSSTFTGTLNGMASATTGSVHYKQTGKQVTLHVGEASFINGTSNSVLFTMTGLPAALRPAATQTVACIVQDAGNVLMGNATIGINGTISFGKLGVSGSDITIGQDFTNSGSKGLPPGWSMTYAL